ncbi:MAG: TonB-dependent receptor [Bacteroidota bacterium]
MTKRFAWCLSLLLFGVGLLQAQHRVSGQVIDANGEPLIGVNVTIVDQAGGTSTDFDGNYALDLSSSNATLLFSYISYQSQSIAVDGRNTINVTLQEAANELEEVVVIGYGTQKKADLTGSVASVGEADIQQISVASAMESIKGRVPGVEIMSSDAAPGATPNIKIRGHNTLSGTNEPLVVVDGFTRGGDLRALNPRDIESIEVLKDASATAIYGARGANGVILITTKSGTTGAPKISLSSAVTSKQLLRTIDMLNGQQFLDLKDDAGLFVTDEERQTAANRNWQDEVYKDGFLQNHQLSALGGTDQVKYAISGSWFDDDDVVVNSYFRRYSVRARVDANLGKFFRISNILYVSRNESNGVPRNNPGYIFDPSLPLSALTFHPNLEIRDEFGNYSSTQAVTNPVAIAQERTNLREENYNYNYSTLEFEPLAGLIFKSTLGITRRNGVNKQYWPSSVRSVTTEGDALIANNNDLEWSNENIVTYANSWGGHNFSVTGGFTQESARFEFSSSAGSGFLSDDLTVNNLQGALNDETISIASGANVENLQSFLGRLTYNFNSKYYLTASFRREGNSKFARNNKWGNFPGLALAWRISEEGFLSGVDALDNLKLRLSYGATGNSTGLGFYESLLSFAPVSDFGAAVFNNQAQVSLQTANLGNPDLRWEKSTQYNIGIDLELFNQRVSVVADAYHKETSDLLLLVNLPSGFEVSTRRENVGSMENRGFELGITTDNIITKNFNWRTTFNYSFNRNEVTDLGEEEFYLRGPNAGIMDTPPMIIQVGKPLGSFFGYVHDGIFPDNIITDRIDYSAVLNFENLEGYRRLVDINGDNRITTADRTIIGSAQPDFTFGFINAFNYKNFDLNIYVQGVIGQEIYNLNRYYIENTNLKYNGAATLLDRWSEDNRNSDLPGAGKFANLGHSYNVEDGSYIKFRDIQLGYTLPTEWLKKARISYARVFVALQNFFLITDYSGYDPEVNYAGGSSEVQGLDLGAYPGKKSVTVGLNIDFQ